MLVNLKQDVRAGDEIEVILHFKNSEDIKVAVPVRETATPEQDHPSEDHWYGNFSAYVFVNRKKELEEMKKLLVLLTVFAVVLAACSAGAQA